MATHPNSLAAPRGAWRWIRDVVLTAIGFAFFSGLVFAFIKAATEEHWSLGLVVTISCAAGAVYLGVSDLRSRQAQEFPIHEGVGIACLTAFTAVAVAASASLQLQRAGWAVYEPTPPADQAYGNFATYYIWVLLDMLPGLQATDLLCFDPSLKPKNAVAGVPVIAFRMFVLFGLFAALRVWWKGRQNLPLRESLKSTSVRIARIRRLNAASILMGRQALRHRRSE